MTQKERVQQYLEDKGSINPIEALGELGVYRLSAVILMLRKEGYDIQTVMTSHEGAYGRVRYATYFLLNEEL